MERSEIQWRLVSFSVLSSLLLGELQKSADTFRGCSEKKYQLINLGGLRRGDQRKIRRSSLESHLILRNEKFDHATESF